MVLSVEEAEYILESTAIDIAFIDASHRPEEIRKLTKGLTAEQTTRPPFVALINGELNSETSSADLMLYGCHAIVYSPFSAERISESVKLANLAKLNNSRLRIRTVVGLMVAELMPDFADLNDRIRLESKPTVQRVQDAMLLAKCLTGESLSRIKTISSEVAQAGDKAALKNRISQILKTAFART